MFVVSETNQSPDVATSKNQVRLTHCCQCTAIDSRRLSWFWEQRKGQFMRPRKPSGNGQQRADAERRSRQTERLARVLRLLLLLQSPRSRDARELAEKLGCSERTVYRDLQVLVAAGVPVYFDEHDRCYRIRKAWRLAAMSPNDLA